MKLIDVFKITEEILRDFDLPLLCERYDTMKTKMNQAANKVIRSFVEYAVNKTKSNKGNREEKTDYYYLAEFLANEGKNITKNVDIYRDTVNVGKHTINVRFTVLKEDSGRSGTTQQNTKTGEITVFILFNPFEIKTIEQSIRLGNRERHMRDVMFKKTSTLVHEMTHFIQISTGKTDKKNIVKIEEIQKGLKNMGAFLTFLKRTQTHEVEATLNQAYKLYYERSNQATGEKKKGSFWRYIVYVVLFCDSNRELGKDVLGDKRSLRDVFTAPNLQFEQFLIAWLLFYYIPKYSVFNNILFKGEKIDLKDKVDVNIVISNKKNIDEFIDGINSFDELQDLNNRLGEVNLYGLENGLFSLVKSNKDLLYSLT